MFGTRELDAIRQMPKKMETLTAKVKELEELVREDHKVIKELLRSIKAATVRGYKNTEPAVEIPVPQVGGAGGNDPSNNGGFGGSSR